MRDSDHPELLQLHPASDEMTVSELARQIHLHPKTVSRLLAEGKLPGVKYGHEWRIRRVEFEEWRKAQQRTRKAG